jgi:tetratricopeptide (TPR) repeat protein
MRHANTSPPALLRALALLLAAQLLGSSAALAQDDGAPAKPEPQAAPPAAEPAAPSEKPAETAGGAKKKKEEQAIGLNPHIARRLAKAVELFEADKLDEALAVVNELAGRRRLRPPDLAQIHRFRGFIYLAKGDSDKAAVELELALEQHGLDRFAEQQTMYSLAQLYTQNGKYDRALALIDSWFASADAPTADAYFLKAMILMQQEKYKAAVEPARLAVEMTPTPKESWIRLLIAVYTQLEEFENVATYLERLIAMSPNKKQYWIQLAAVRNHLKQDSRALAAMQLANEGELLSEDKELRQLSRLLFARELPLQCAQELDAAIAKGVVKADAETYRMLSNCYIAARESELALEPLARAGELSKDGESYMLLAQMYLQREKFDEALAALDKALAKSKPEQKASVQLLIGVALLGSDRLDEAERSFRAASGDKKVGDAAKSYLKFVEDERLRKAALSQQAQLTSDAAEP